MSVSAALEPAAQAPRITVPCSDCGRTFKTPQALKDHRKDTHDKRGWAPRQAAPKERIILCPACLGPAKLSQGKFGLKAECCGLWSWKGKPLVDRETHAARIMAHDAFDAVWKNGHMQRSEAYERLATAMQMTRKECHISLMTADQAHRVIAIMRRHFESPQ